MTTLYGVFFDGKTLPFTYVLFSWVLVSSLLTFPSKKNWISVSYIICSLEHDVAALAS